MFHLVAKHSRLEDRDSVKQNLNRSVPSQTTYRSGWHGIKAELPFGAASSSLTQTVLQCQAGRKQLALGQANANLNGSLHQQENRRM